MVANHLNESDAVIRIVGTGPLYWFSTSPSTAKRPDASHPRSVPRLGPFGIVVQVAFLEWTPYGKLRHSRFLGIRSDKPARQVVRESA